jgi:photosystem II stability/assembly factor-like uncharacterized protein
MSAHRVYAALFASVLIALALLIPATAQNPSGKPASEPYTWKNVQMVGGGFVDGIIFHPTAKGVRYARTDMGGAYRWNAQTKRWEPVLDWVGYEDSNLMGVESIAPDPSDASRVYMACGTYTTSSDDAILRSHDGGRTFERTNVPIRFGGNEDGRGNGERMTVDPNNGKILYLGTRQNGLWRSTDGAVTWSKVDSFPDVTEAPPAAQPGRGAQPGAGGGGGGRGGSRGDGIVVTLVDPRSGSKGKTSSTIYAAVSLMGRDNLFRSTDSGKTWQPVPGQPTQYRPTHMVMASDGTLYLSYGTSPGPSSMTAGGVWKLDTKSGAWTEITPVKPDARNTAFGWAAVSVDAHDPKVVIASTAGRRNSAGGEDELYRTIDGGKTWKAVFESGGYDYTLAPYKATTPLQPVPPHQFGPFDYSLAPYTATTPIHWMFDVEIDPLDPKHAMFTTGYGGWETFNLTDMDAGKPTKWSIMASGIEQIAELEMTSPTKGAHLLSAIGDYGGFVHWDLDKPAPEGASSPPVFNNSSGIAYAENKPEVIVRVGVCSHHHQPGFNISYSLDSGKTWQPPATQPATLPSAGGPGGGGGRGPSGPSGGDIAISSDGATWVWITRGAGPALTTDKGATWTAIKGLPATMRIVADRVNPKKFYGVSLYEGKLFLSTDGAANFVEQAFTLPGGLPTRSGTRIEGGSGWDRLYTTPGREGDLWLTMLSGLYHSTDTGKTFTRTAGVSELRGFGFGKAAPGASDPALYLVGVANGVRGILRSNDYGRTWVRINDDQHQFGLIGQITGDPKQYGRVYVGTFGRGIVYGDPARKKT